MHIPYLHTCMLPSFRVLTVGKFNLCSVYTTIYKNFFFYTTIFYVNIIIYTCLGICSIGITSSFINNNTFLNSTYTVYFYLYLKFLGNYLLSNLPILFSMTQFNY